MKFDVNLVETKLERTVDYAFRQSRQELLPEEIRRDSLVHWILEFDNNRRDGEYGYNYRDDYLAPFIAQLVQGSLTPNISFYFGSLFHIGRQWSVSEQATRTAQQALQRDNLQVTINHNIHLFQDQLQELEIPESEQQPILLDALAEIFQLAIQRHSQKIETARRWWFVWQKEVSELKDITIRCSQEYNEYSYRRREKYRDFDDYEYRRFVETLFSPSLLQLLTFSYQTKHLSYLFSQDGIKIDNVAINNNPIQNPITIAALLPLLLQSEDIRYELRHFVEEYHRILKTEQELTTQRQLAPIIQQVESNLLKIFKTENPFDKYTSFKSTPDLFLKELWNKCTLPNGKVFHYAQKWIDALESIPSFSTYGRHQYLPFKSPPDEDTIESYARSADATIRRKWIKASRTAGETDVELTQSLFEKNWVTEMAKGAVNSTKRKQVSERWNLDSFKKMLEKVVEYLNVLVGYKLEVPNETRLKTLWDLLKNGKTYDIEW